MPETKHNFTGGKMNKDLDERLIPNGEYRDAMNIQVSTSEDSDVGTVQNILGNKAGCVSSVFEENGQNVSFNPQSSIPIGSKVIGSVSDEKNDNLYWLISGSKSIVPGTNTTLENLSSYLNQGNILSESLLPIRLKDMIMRKTKNRCEPVFVDKYGLIVSNKIETGEAVQFIENTNTNTLALKDPSLLSEIFTGMQVQGIKANGGMSATAHVTSIGSLFEIETPYALNYDHIPLAPVFNSGGQYNSIAKIGSIQGELTTNQVGQTGIATNKIYIYQADFPFDLQVGDFIDVWFHGSNVGTSNFLEFLTPQIADIQGNVDPNISQSTHAFVTDISSPIVFTTNQNMSEEPVIRITLSQQLIDPVTGVNFQSAISPIFTGVAPFYLTSQASNNAIVNANIRFISNPTSIQVNNIVTLPQNSPWLNEIYNIFYPNGTLDPNIEVRIRPNTIWTEFPANSGHSGCIAPLSVSPPDTAVIPNVYDNEFAIVECGTQAAMPPPTIGSGRSGPPNTSFTLFVHDISNNTSTPFGENLISLSREIDLSTGFDFLHFSHDRVLNYEHDKIITGINIIDDMLLWVDGVDSNGTEPKKINITRSIEGTYPNGNRHTLLINDLLNYNQANIHVPIKEEHITLVKKSPQTEPTIELVSGRNENMTYTGVVRVANDFDPNASAASPDPDNDIISNNNYDFSTIEPGDVIRLKINEDIDGNSGFSNFSFDWKVGDDVVLKEFSEDGDAPSLPITDFRLKGKITEWQHNTITNGKFRPDNFGYVGSVLVQIEIDSIVGFPPGPITGESSRKYAIDLFDTTERLFEFKFPRFSFRYKYEDGEYSAYSPFSPVAFLPGGFDYHPKKGYNIGMTNRAKSVIVKDFINETTPKDVVEIDILYKEDASPNVYVVDTIKPDDDVSTYNAFNAWMSNSYEITSDTIHAVLPSNQLLRPWDNVPKKALAQEITGSRVVYGNYLQNFDLKSGNTIKNYYPEFKTSITKFDDVASGALKSIKSLREYQIGVVFIDEYGRETPVISNPTGTLKLEKIKGEDSNRLVVGFGKPNQLFTGQNNYPKNMKYFKFFIKETSGEYYNMAMDRFYDAEDGNVWLSFPSSDRNKVDIDTFLILKKGVESDNIVEKEGRYKILAIENEAPDYVKTKKLLLYSRTADAAGGANGAGDIFNEPDHLPLESRSSFKINFSSLADSSARELDKLTAGTTDKLYVELASSGGGKVSKRYRVVDVGLSDDGGTPPIPDLFNIKIEGVFGSDVNAFTNDPSGLSSSSIIDGVQLRIYKYIIENSPEFDGRFFVKIFSDNTFEENITNSVTDDSQDYRIVEEKKLYLLTDNLTNKLRHKYVFNQSNPPNTSLSNVFSNYYDLGLFRNSNKRDSSHFKWNRLVSAINRMGSGVSFTPYSNSSGNSFWNWYEGFGATHTFNGINGANWQPYEAFFRGINIKGSSSQAFKLGIDDRVSAGDVKLEGNTTSDASFEDVWYIDNSTKAGTHQFGFTFPNGQDASPNGVDKSGVGISADGLFIEISFGGIQDGSGTYKNGWAQASMADGRRGLKREKYYDIGGVNENYTNEAGFCNAMVPGAQFRFKEDPAGTIYTITGAVNNGFNVVYEDLMSPTQLSTGQHPSHGGSYTMSTSTDNQGGGRLLLAQASGMQPKSVSNNNNPFSHSQYGESPQASPNGYRVSTYFRPANFSRSWRFMLDKPISWNPIGASLSPIFGGKVIKLTATSTSACTNQITLSTITDTVDSKSLLEAGMVLNSVDGTEDSLASASLAVVANITKNASGDFIIDLKKYRSEDGLNISSFTPSGTSGGEIIFKQYAMNGISPNSAKNINFFGNAQGFNDTNHGVAAVGYSIEFVEPLVGDVSLPTNPAIWETEPKKSTDLDIYYEASGYNPLILDQDTIKTVLPVGSIVSSIGTDAVPPNTTIVQNQMPGLSSGQAVAIVLSNSSSTAQGSFTSIGSSGDPLDGGSQLKVTRPDGSAVVVVIANQESDLMFTSPTYAGRVFGIFKFIYSSDYYLNWHNCYSFGNGVESNRIRDNFNLPFISNGVKASTTLSEQYKEEHRKYGLIYSGIYNSISGVNNLNQFLAAEKITKDINPIYGSIQKLHTRDTDLVTLCEDKILKILANKDAVFNADGNTQLTATANVLGQTIPFVGEYGISKNPESFASESYRAYFTDKVRGTVMRLSKDGLTSISDAGMKDWFRDNLKLSNILVGSYDDRQNLYNITLVKNDETINGSKVNKSTTVSFSENVRGWVSFKSFVPEEANSCANNYYTFKHGHLYIHHVEDEEIPNNRNTFYNNYRESSIKVVLNEMPGSIKNYRTLNYEGSHSKVDENLQDNDYYNLSDKKGWYVTSIKTDQQEGGVNEFIEKEGKWYNYIKGKTVTTSLDGHLTNHFSSFDEGDFAVQGLGFLQNSTQKSIRGCTDSNASNFDSLATVDDGSCAPNISGCTDSTADNFLPAANTDDGTCQFSGCTDSLAFNYNSKANVDDGSCITKVLGCTDTSTFTQTYTSTDSSTGLGFTAVYNTMINANSGANTDDGSCTPTILGCTDPSQNGYDPSANTPYHTNYIGSGACQGSNVGCHYPAGIAAWNNFKAACNHDPLVANVFPNNSGPSQGGSCVWCSDLVSPNVQNYHASIGDPIGSNSECGTGENEQKDGCRYCGGQHKVQPHPIVVPESVRISTDPALSQTCEALLVIHHIKENDPTNQGTLLTHQSTFNSSSGDVNYMVTITNTDTGVVHPAVQVTNGIATAGVNPVNSSLPAHGNWEDDMIAYSAEFGFDKSQYIQSGHPATFHIKQLDDGTNYMLEYHAVCSQSSGQTLPLGSGVYSTTFTTPIIQVLGCTDNNGTNNPNGNWGACNFDPAANTDDGTCEYTSCTGCTQPGYLNSLDPIPANITQHDQSLCGDLVVSGCTDPLAQNYDSAANVDDGSCIANVYGCLGTYAQGSPSTPWTNYIGQMAAANFGCAEGSTSTQNCNMQNNFIAIPLTQLQNYYLPISNPSAAPLPIVTSQVDPTVGGIGISNCQFTNESINITSVPSTQAGALGAEQDIEVTITQHLNTPWDNVIGAPSNLRYHVLVQFLDGSDSIVGPTNLGSYDTSNITTSFNSQNSTAVLQPEAVAMVTEFQNSSGNYGNTIFPQWANGTASFTGVTSTDLASAAQAGATKANIAVVAYNDLIYNEIPGQVTPASATLQQSGLVHSVTQVSFTLGCTDPNSFNYNSSATVNDGSCTYLTAANSGCTNVSFPNYDPNAAGDLLITSANPNGSCAACQPPTSGITSINYDYAFPTTYYGDITIQWDNNIMLFGEHNVQPDGINYSLVNSAGSSINTNLLAQGLIPISEIQNSAHLNAIGTAVSSTHVKAATHIIEYKINSGSWRNLRNDTLNINLSSNFNSINYLGFNVTNIPSPTIPNPPGAYGLTAFSGSGSTGVNNNNNNGIVQNATVTGPVSILFSNGIAANGIASSTNFGLGSGTPGFNPGDQWSFRMKSVCYHPGDNTTSESAYTETITFTQPTCAQINANTALKARIPYHYGC